jgi:carbamoyl-phosphate synthase large subunit
MIDLAEDRDRFQKLLHKLDLVQPNNGIAYSVEQARLVATDIGFPLVVRPSYVLGGRAMQIIRDEAGLSNYLLGTVPELVPEDIKARYPNDKTGQINTLLGTNPLLFDSYLTNAIEVDVDCLCDGTDVNVTGIMEHIEEAGIHSGDSAPARCRFTRSRPRWSTGSRAQTVALARALNVGGLMNVQYAIKDDDIYVLEVNPRASRTVPFVAKTVGAPIAKVAARVMAGENLADAFGAYGTVPDHRKLNHIAVKEAVFPFAKFPGVDTLLGPEMRSTGEVMGLDRDYALAFAKAQLGAGPRRGQAARCRGGSHPHRQWLQADGHRRHRRLSRRAGLRRRARQQGDGRPSAHRGRHPQPPGPDGAQHHRGRQDHLGLEVAAPRSPDAEGALFHHHGR